MPDLKGSTLFAAGLGSAANAVSRIDPRLVSDWDATVGRLGGSVFHRAGWVRVLAETYGYRPVYHIHHCAAGFAILPLMEVDSWLTGRRGISLPFTDECGPIGGGAPAHLALFEAALEYGRSRRWKYLECRGGSHLLPDAPPSLSFYGHRLDLRGAEAELFDRIDSSGRRAIRKAQHHGVTVEFSTTPEATRTFYLLMCRTRKRHGLPPQPRRFFDAIQSILLAPGTGVIALARRNGTPVAGAVFLHSGSTALYKFGASDETFQELRGNNLVMWEAIRWHAERGFTTLDFGRTSIANEGLRRFKLSWGTQEYTTRYIKFDIRANAFVSDRDHSSGWHNRIFRFLPLAAARLTGALLYKHVA